jgi:2-aminoadipate transaminase
VHWTRQQGGLFLWVILPETVDATLVLEEAITEIVAFVPGSAFFAYGSGHNTFRLNFSNATPERIEKGMRRLAGVLSRRA